MQTAYDETIKDYICRADKPVFRVREVIASPDYTLRLTFSNGEKRIYDARQLLSYDVFAPLNDINLFLRAHCDGCAVAWNDDIDIAPESLYANSIPVQ